MTSQILNTLGHWYSWRHDQSTAHLDCRHRYGRNTLWTLRTRKRQGLVEMNFIDKWKRKRRIKKLVSQLIDFDPGSDYDEEGIPYWDKWHLKEEE